MRKIETVVHMLSTKEPTSDYQYWLKQPAVTRLAALENLRQQFYRQSDGTRSRFQRVYRIIEQTRD
jgi:hypothetical protein